MIAEAGTATAGSQAAEQGAVRGNYPVRRLGHLRRDPATLRQGLRARLGAVIEVLVRRLLTRHSGCWALPFLLLEPLETRRDWT